MDEDSLGVLNGLCESFTPLYVDDSRSDGPDVEYILWSYISIAFCFRRSARTAGLARAISLKIHQAANTVTAMLMVRTAAEMIRC